MTTSDDSHVNGGYVTQLPDVDPEETAEWTDSMDALVDTSGPRRARYILTKLTDRARDLGVPSLVEVSSPYVNTIPPSAEAWFPGDVEVERRLRAYIRWNAAVMVVNANHRADGIGGHLSTYASSAGLYELGFNHFFRGKSHGDPGDHVYFQGHAAPGMYARAFLERRLDEVHLSNFRRELSEHGLSSYPHPWLMSDFWEFPTVSMGLGPINSIYHARFNKYLHNRRIDDTSHSRVWCFLGDGECDEPETLGSISLAGREHLDNLTWVVNCNLQRLDGPVRGNGKIIQELEAVFRGAGWNVIKVIWGAGWDELLARDRDGVLLEKMNTSVDGEFQRYATESGAYIREHFFGPDPRLRALVSHLSDDELRNLPRGGHDYRKMYAAYAAATATRTMPTVILAKTIKGWTLGHAAEGRNASHQVKKLTHEQLGDLRHRLHLEDVISDEQLTADEPPYYRPDVDSTEYRYLMERRALLGGSLPMRSTAIRRPLVIPPANTLEEFDAGSNGAAVSTTMSFTRLLRTLARVEEFGPRIVPIIPDEARTFGMDSLFREFGIYAYEGQRYESVDAQLLLSYTESQDGQLLEEGITEAGSMGSFTAAGTAYATRGVPMVPFYIFYSMFGFQRVGDLIWAGADAQAKGFLLGATAGRTTLLGEGLQHQDGHSLLLASTVPTCQAYDPAFAYEVAAIVRSGLARMYGGVDAHGVAGGGDSVFYYLTLYNENYPMPPRPAGVTDDDIMSGLYKWAGAPDGVDAAATLLFSGSAQGAARAAQEVLASQYGVGVELWSATSYKRLREDALSVERHNRLHPLDSPLRAPVTERLLSAPGPIVAVTDFMRAVPDQIAPFVPPLPPDTSDAPRAAVPHVGHRRIRSFGYSRGPATVLRDRRSARRGGDHSAHWPNSARSIPPSSTRPSRSTGGADVADPDGGVSVDAMNGERGLTMTEVLMPELGEDITEGTITKWFKSPGEHVDVAEALFEVSTEKVDAEVPSPLAGTVTEILVAAGTVVEVGAVVAHVEVASELSTTPTATPTPSSDESEPDRAARSATTPATVVASAPEPPPPPPPMPVAPTAAHERDDRLVTSPVVRKLLKELGPDADAVTGTGPNGRVTRKDAERAASAGSRAPAVSTRPAMSPSASTTPTTRPSGFVPFNKTRQVTGDKMVASKAIAPHVLSAIEVDYERVEVARRAFQERWRREEGFSLTYLPFVCRALVQALHDFPLLNASVVDGGVDVHDHVDLNIAVDLNFDGLLAPVIRRAGDKRLGALAREIADLASRARSKRLHTDDVSGGTFTVSNSGPFGTFMVAPIINQPQVAILSTDGVSRKPVVVTDQFGGEAIAIHSVGMLVLSWDHRAFDGAYAAAFLRSLKTTLEEHDWLSEF